ncbi:hypothetical protein BGZ82_005624 [Podila clonocystis]|nr:hypothetical protein BGZ82_005624 [Podila clonocystis]
MLIQSSSFAAVVLSSIILVGHHAPVADAHSWLECVNWKFNNPSKPDWTMRGGRCEGYARRFPLGHKFASMDSSPARHYQQGDNPDRAPPCSTGKTGKERGMDETLASPRGAAYDQNGWGKMTQTRVGAKLCLRWPAKTHGNENSKVQVGLSKNADEKDPSQKDFTDNLQVAELPYGNCMGNGGKDATPCGGCFEVPERNPGGYVLQWRWELNEGEWYTSCAALVSQVEIVGWRDPGLKQGTTHKTMSMEEFMNVHVNHQSTRSNKLVAPIFLPQVQAVGTVSAPKIESHTKNFRKYCPDNIYISMIVAYPTKWTAKLPAQSDATLDASGVQQVVINVGDNNFGETFSKEHVEFVDTRMNVRMRFAEDDDDDDDRTKKQRGRYRESYGVSGPREASP